MDTIKELTDFILKIKKEHNLKTNQIVNIIEEAKLQALDIILSEDDFKYVLKRNGSIEKYSPEKLYYSISNAADGINEPMNRSDIEWIIKDVEKNFSKREILSSTEIRDYAKDYLMKNGYLDVSKNFY